MLRTLPGSRRLHRKLVTGSSGVNQDVASATLPLWVCSRQATGGATGERNVVHRHHPHAARRRSEPGCWSSVGHSRHGGVEAAGGGLAVTHRVPVAVVVAVLRHPAREGRATAKSAWHNYVLASVSLLVYLKLDLQIPTQQRLVALLGCLHSLQLSLCARKKVCACDMTAGAVAWTLLALSVC